MICFQISIFELLETTERAKSKGTECCDLLSNQYIWTTGNNYVVGRSLIVYVVICFQISIFELLETTRKERLKRNKLLWFAFKSVYLNYWKQLFRNAVSFEYGCDLLSNQYIWTTGNNCYLSENTTISVVICFQISIFELLETTVATTVLRRVMLWFAFKSVYLNYWKQRYCR